MAELDPRIPLGIRPFQLEGPMDQAQKALTLSGLIEQQRMRQMQAQEAQRKAAQQMEYRAALQAAGDDPEKQVAIARRYGDPKDVLNYAQGSLDRRAQMQQRLFEHQQALQAKKEQAEQALAAKMELAQQAGADRRTLMQMQLEGRKEIAQLAQGLRQPPAVTPVTIQDPNDPNSTIVIDGRTRQVLGKGPKLTDVGKDERKRSFQMEGIGGDLQQADDLLRGIKRDPETGAPMSAPVPTGSGIGSMVDTAASWIGVTPSGAAEADALKVVAGRLLQKIPRFEGPQSDKDVVLYKQMAADAGNEKLPRARRIMAVSKMREIYSRYETGSSGKIAGERRAVEEPPPGAVRRK